MSALHLWNRKVYGYGTPADREAAQEHSKPTTRETREMERAGLITPAEGEHCRKAAEVAISDAYHPGYKIPCESKGDIFYPAIITNHGGWYYQSSDFLRAMTHSGDKVDCTDLEAERFDHYSRMWASWKHSTFLINASCGMQHGTGNLHSVRDGQQESTGNLVWRQVGSDIR